ncbi:MAG: bacillithiol biosynthesis BshC, partial [Balneolales bacterium]
EKADAIHDALDQQSSRLEQEFHRQAQVQGTTLFLHDEQKGRIRLNNSNGAWSSECGSQWTNQELLELANTHPQKFSPNVFLRPILQDYLLPNIAYIGGPAEVAYYGQMRSVYPLFGMKMPAIIPRLSATLIESSVARILKQLPFEPHEYKSRVEDLEKTYIEKLGHGEVDELFTDWKAEITSISEEYTEYIAEYDASLKGSAGKETSSYLKSIDKLHQKLTRSIKQKEEIQLKRIRKIQHHLFPNGQLQEREISVLHFMNKYGTGIWGDILDNLDSPYFKSHKLLYL